MALVSPTTRNRKCTDIPCLAVFAAFLVGWAVVASIAIQFGSIQRFTMPSDSEGHICGVDKSVKEKPYLLFFDLSKCARPSVSIFGCPTPQMCVSECPNTYFYGVLSDQDKNPAFRLLQDHLSKRSEKSGTSPKSNVIGPRNQSTDNEIGSVFDELSPEDIDSLKANISNLSIAGNLSQDTENELKAHLHYCLPHVNRDALPYKRLVDGYHCAPWYAASRPVAGRCLPRSAADAVDKLNTMSSDLKRNVSVAETKKLLSKMNVTGDSSNSSVGGEVGTFLSDGGTAANQTNATAGSGGAHGVMDGIGSGLNGTGKDEPEFEIAQSSDGNNITENVMLTAADAISQMRFVVTNFSSLTCLSLALALVLSLMFVLLLRCLACPVIWCSLVGAILALAAVSVGCFLEYRRLGDDGNDDSSRGNTNSSSTRETEVADDMMQYARTRLVWLVLTILFGVLAVLVLVLVIALRRRIQLTVALLEQCSVALSDMLTVLLVPAVTFMFQLACWLAFWLVLLHLFGTVRRWRVVGECSECDEYSTGDTCYPDHFDEHCAKTCPAAACNSDQDLVLYIYNILALVWALGFVAAINQIAVAMSFCTWYFSEYKKLGAVIPMASYLLTLAFHSGTAAFGSLLLALCRLVRWMLEGIRQRTEGAGCMARCCVSCCACCCACVEGCLQFMTTRAYIVTALDGCSLCTGARRGMDVVSRNIARVAVTDSVTSLVLFLGRVLVIVTSTALCHLLMSGMLSDAVPWSLPALYSAILANLVAGAVFTVFDMGVDTIFYCAMVDLDINDGSAQMPYMMSSSLASVLGVKNQPTAPRTSTAVAANPSQPVSATSQRPDTKMSRTAGRGSPDTPTNFRMPGEVENYP